MEVENVLIPNHSFVMLLLVQVVFLIAHIKLNLINQPSQCVMLIKTITIGQYKSIRCLVIMY